MIVNLTGKLLGISYLFKWGGKCVFLGNLREKDATKYDIKDNFIRELIEIWVDFNFKDSFLSKRDFCSSMIWNNSLVRIANRPFFYQSINQSIKFNVDT